MSWPRQEYAALGLPFHRRGAMTDEYLEVIIRSWPAETISYSGSFVSFEDVARTPSGAPTADLGGRRERRAIAAFAPRRACGCG